MGEEGGVGGERAILHTLQGRPELRAQSLELCVVGCGFRVGKGSEGTGRRVQRTGEVVGGGLGLVAQRVGGLEGGMSVLLVG